MAEYLIIKGEKLQEQKGVAVELISPRKPWLLRKSLECTSQLNLKRTQGGVTLIFCI